MPTALENARLDATRLLMRFLDPALVSQRTSMILELRPRPGDYARAFANEVAEAVGNAYETIWQSTPVWRFRPDQTQLRVNAATVEELREGAGQAVAFPGGYREASPLLQAGKIWICWELLAPGALAGVAFDGLVLLDDRWVWFPKPWRAIPKKKTTSASHWTE